MLNKYFFFLTALTILTSCLDRSNYQDIGKATLEAVIQNDTVSLKKFFIYEMDSLDALSKAILLKEITKVKDKDYSLIKVDTSKNGVTVSSTDGEIIYSNKWNELDTYFKIDTSYYVLNSRYELNEKNEVTISTLTISNLTEACVSWNKKIYCPRDSINFTSLSWSFDAYSNVFSSGRVGVENTSKSDLNYLKFRLIIRNFGQIILNQTIVHTETIYSGDLNYIDIPGLRNLYTFSSVSENSIEFEATLIEVLPKPESFDCKKILELKEHE